MERELQWFIPLLGSRDKNVKDATCERLVVFNSLSTKKIKITVGLQALMSLVTFCLTL